MIKKLTSMNKYSTAHLKCAMDSDWDILQVLHRLMNQMKERPILEWAASHQDDNPTIDITTLSTGTQINIEADGLTTKGLQRLHTKPKIPLNPLSDVMLYQGGRTITRDLKTSLRTNIQLPILERYYQRKFCLTNLVYGNVDWEIFTPVFCRYKNKDLQWINKF